MRQRLQKLLTALSSSCLKSVWGTGKSEALTVEVGGSLLSRSASSRDATAPGTTACRLRSPSLVASHQAAAVAAAAMRAWAPGSDSCALPPWQQLLYREDDAC